MTSLAVELQHRQGAFTLDVQFEAAPGVTVLYGRSGAGKTTVINAIAGLLVPDKGRVLMGERVLTDTATGRHVRTHQRRVGYVFQNARLFPHRDTRANLTYSRRARSGSTAFDAVVGMLGLEHLLDRRPSSLSGGEAQRVSIGRALLSEPELLLMDEPLASLDTQRKEEILPYLEQLRDETDIPIVYVSHAIAEVARLATTIVVLDDGRVVANGMAHELLSDPGLAPRLGVREAGAVLTGRVVAHHADGLSEFEFDGGRLLLAGTTGRAGAALRVRIEAQDVLLASTRPDGLSALNILAATVMTLREGDGPGVLVQLQIGEALLLARVTRRAARSLNLHEGMPCFAVINSLSIARSDVGQ